MCCFREAKYLVISYSVLTLQLLRLVAFRVFSELPEPCVFLFADLRIKAFLEAAYA